MEQASGCLHHAPMRANDLAHARLGWFPCLALAVGTAVLFAAFALFAWGGAVGTSLSYGWAAALPVHAGGRELTAGAATDWGYLLTVLLALGSATGSFLAVQVVRDSSARRFAVLGLFCSAVILVAGLVAQFANGVAIGYLAPNGAGNPDAAGRWQLAASIADVIALAALVPAVAVALSGLCLTVGRLVGLARSRAGRRSGAKRDSAWRRSHLDNDEVWAPGRLERGDALRPSSSSAGSSAKSGAGSTTDSRRWVRGYNVPGVEDKPTRTGISVSGGGVRAGIVALGALQSAGLRKKLLAADYLVSVSGGGYIAGAFQQALSDVPPARLGDAKIVRKPETVLLPGTVEEDYVRRHASYLANTTGELMVALAMMALHLVMTLALLFAPAIVAGIVLGLSYNALELADFHGPLIASGPGPDVPTVTPEALWSLGIMTGLAMLVWLASSILRSRRAAIDSEARRTFAASKTRAMRAAGDAEARRNLAASKARAMRASRDRWASGFEAVAQLLGALATMIGIVTLGVPWLVWLSARLLRAADGGVSLELTTGIGILVAYLGALAAFLAKKSTRQALGGAAASAKTAMKRIPAAVGNLLLVALALFVIIAGWLLVLGGFAAATYDTPLSRGILITGGAALLYLVIMGGLADETTLSLNRFYRRRLASAFAVRRVTVDDGEEVAEPYDFREPTVLSRYGCRPVDDDGRPAFPQVIFAASATLGDDRTPSGANRVSYTMSGDWVGGPDIGYVCTAALERICPPRIRRDLTVQGAVATSGAALAASVGGQGSPWYQTLLALTGARLGTWLPNPHYVMHRYPSPRARATDLDFGWSAPAIPTARRMVYLLRELFGPHGYASPLLQVTDGGFYDNLGLIELLRRRCTEIYCVDASGDAPPSASTISRVVGLAYAELGVTIAWSSDPDPWSLTPGSGVGLDPSNPLSALNSRLCKNDVITGTVTYPPESGLPEGQRTGTIRIAKASLRRDLDFDLLTYALTHPDFPNDSTADQWFDDEDYSAYSQLGRGLGERLCAPATVAAIPRPIRKTGVVKHPAPHVAIRH